MRKIVFTLGALAAALLGQPALAAGTGLHVTFISAARWPWDVGEGHVHAFTCISLDTSSGIKEDCYGFYPAVAVGRIRFAGGKTITRTGDASWREDGSPFSFAQQPDPNSKELMLFDRSRNFHWRVPIKGGMSQWKQGSGGWSNFLAVAGYDVGSSSLMGLVKGGPGAVYSEFETAPERLTSSQVSVTKEITTAQRSAIFNEMKKWENGTYNLLSNNCIGLVRSLAIQAGLNAPAVSAGQLPKSYLTALKAANPGT